jgi:membrane protein
VSFFESGSSSVTKIRTGIGKMDRADERHGQDRSADIPRDISEQGWWNILKRVYADLDNKNISVLAAGIAFYAMLSIFPALAVLIAVYGILANPTTVQHLTDTMHGIMPGEAQKLIEGYLQALVSPSQSKFGTGLVVSFLVALWSAQYASATLMESLNVIYGEQEKRGTLRFYLISFALTIAAMVFVVVALTFVAAIPAIMQILRLSEKVKIIGALAPWPILLVFVAFGLAAVYRFAPCRREPRWRWVSWGSIGATVLWMTASAAFSFYVAKFNSYDKTFGSLGAVVVLLTWLYLSAYAVLLGACLNAEMETPGRQSHDHP